MLAAWTLPSGRSQSALTRRLAENLARSASERSQAITKSRFVPIAAIALMASNLGIRLVSEDFPDNVGSDRDDGPFDYSGRPWQNVDAAVANILPFGIDLLGTAKSSRR